VLAGALVEAGADLPCHVMQQQQKVAIQGNRHFSLQIAKNISSVIITFNDYKSPHGSYVKNAQRRAAQLLSLYYIRE
jgi:hypothetical protein